MTPTEHTLTSSIHTNIKLNPTYKNNGCISFLNLLIIQKTSNPEIDIVCKPTHRTQNCCFLDTTLPECIPSNTEDKTKKKWTLIQTIAQNNNFPPNRLQKLNPQIQHKKTNQELTNERNKTCTTFTYYNPKIRKITNLFKHTDVGISFKNINNLQHLTKPKINNNIQEQDNSRIFELTCNICHMSYIEQMSHSLKQSYQDHIGNIKHNEP
jgi:hypothetical protein